MSVYLLLYLTRKRSNLEVEVEVPLEDEGGKVLLCAVSQIFENSLEDVLKIVIVQFLFYLISCLKNKIFVNTGHCFSLHNYIALEGGWVGIHENETNVMWVGWSR